MDGAAAFLSFVMFGPLSVPVDVLVYAVDTADADAGGAAAEGDVGLSGGA